MKFQVEHAISWQYDRSVFIEPLTIRLRPRCDGSLQLRAWHLAIKPEPSGRCSSLDALGNAVSHVWFNEPHDELNITVNSSLETLLDNPFDYLLGSDSPQDLPFSYEQPLKDWLLPYFSRLSMNPKIDYWAHELAQKSGLAQPFLSDLVSAMFTEFERNTREEGAAYAPHTTFYSRQGTCRDLAVLFIYACRSQGIASRFVSGYAYELGRKGPSDLHAWAEVYLPGAGWRGYDPTLGVAVSDQHIPVASAPEPLGAAPTSGTFRGTEAKSAMEFLVLIETLDDL